MQGYFTDAEYRAICSFSEFAVSVDGRAFSCNVRAASRKDLLEAEPAFAEVPMRLHRVQVKATTEAEGYVRVSGIVLP